MALLASLTLLSVYFNFFVGTFYRGDFQKEVRLMAQLKDPNIVRVIGVCTRDEPQCVIVEYMKYGDLNQYLRTHIPAEGNTMIRKKGSKQLRYGQTCEEL